MTRTEICLTACAGLTDEEIEAVVANGGFARIRETVLVAGKIQSLGERLSILNETKSNLMKARPLLLEILTEMENL